MIVISNRSGKYTFVLSTNNNNHVLIGEKKLDSYHYTGLVFFTHAYVIFQGFFLVFRSKSPKGTCYRKKIQFLLMTTSLPFHFSTVCLYSMQMTFCLVKLLKRFPDRVHFCLVELQYEFCNL